MMVICHFCNKAVNRFGEQIRYSQYWFWQGDFWALCESKEEVEKKQLLLGCDFLELVYHEKKGFML